MSQTPITVTYSLEEILKQISQKLDNLDEKVDHLTVEMATVKTKVEGLESDIKEFKVDQKKATADIADLKGTKSLVIPIVVAVLTSLLTLLIRAIPNS